MLFGLSDEAYLALLSLVILFDHACLAVIVLQQRDTVRDRIRAPAGATGTLASLRSGLAASWHWIALTVLVALWLVRASQVPGGYTRILYLFSVTGAVLLVTWAMRARTLRSLDRVLRLEPTMTSRYPGLETRLNRYRPVLDATAEAVVYIVAVLALAGPSGALRAFGWLLVPSTTRPAADLDRHHGRGDAAAGAAGVGSGGSPSPSGTWLRLARPRGKVAPCRRGLRTLLPMLRTTLLIVLSCWWPA